MENHKVASLKLDNHSLKFNDLKLENDYSPYMSTVVEFAYFFYLFVNLLFYILVIVYNAMSKSNSGLDDSKVSLILSGLWIFSGIIFIIPSLREKIKDYFLIFYAIGCILQIVIIYSDSTTQGQYTDIKVGIQFILLISYPIFFCLRQLNWVLFISILFLCGTIPALFIDSRFFVNPALFKGTDLTSNIAFANSHIKSNIGEYVTVIFVIASTFTIMFIYGYNEEKYSRINFLKINHKKLNFKKDQEIFDNLVPKFVQNKMESNERGASIEEEIVTCLFADICDFDGLIAKMAAKDFINLLDKIYSTFDQLCSIHGLQKIETVGKTYMASGGLRECEKDLEPVILSKHHTIRTFELALDMIDMLSQMRLENGDTIKIKIGIHTKEVNAAVVGNHKPQFSLIGDTVNTTARMCSNSKENSILITQEAYDEISKSYQGFEVQKLNVKGKGEMTTYLFCPLKIKDTNENNEKKKPREYGSIFKSNIQKRGGRDGGLLKEETEDLDRKGSNVSSGSYFLIDHFADDREKKKKNSHIVDIFCKQKSTENPLFKSSFFLHFFNDTNDIKIFKDKSEKPSSIFKSYCDHKFKTNAEITITINYIFICCNIIMLIFLTKENIDNFSYFNSISTFASIKFILCITFYMVLQYAKRHSDHRSFITDLLSFIFYLLYMILCFFQFIVLNDSKQYIFFEVEQNLIVVTSIFSGLITHPWITTISIIHCCFFIAEIIFISKNFSDFEFLLVYPALSILITICMYIFYIFREFISTIEFVENKIHTEDLKAREKLLFNLMPPHVVQHLKEDIPVVDEISDVTMLYTDIVGFTDFSKSVPSPKNVVKMLIELFKRFDDAVLRNDVYKVHTIGDCYVVLGYTGKIPHNERDPQDEAMKVINLGKEMISIIKEVAATKDVNFPGLNMRIGIHTGTLIAGIIGTKIVRYDVFGIDNAIANKMESDGQAGKVNISEDAKRMIEADDIELPFKLTENPKKSKVGIRDSIKSFLVNFDETNSNSNPQ